MSQAPVSTKSPNPADRRIGQRIRQHRLALGMSQSDLAEALGLTFQQIQKYEKGTNRVSAGRLEQIAGVLQVPVRCFFKDGPEAQDVLRLTETTDSLSLLRSFLAIEHPKLQQQVLALVQTMAAVKT